MVFAHFDNSVPGVYRNPDGMKIDYKLKFDTVLIEKGRASGGKFEVYKSQLDGELKIGLTVLKYPEITLLTGGFNAINIDSQFFKKYTITINAKSKLMQIEPNK